MVMSTNSEVSFVLLVPLLRNHFPQRAVNTTQSIVEPPAKVAVIETNDLAVEVEVGVVGVIQSPSHTLLVAEVVLDVVIHHPLE